MEKPVSNFVLIALFATAVVVLGVREIHEKHAPRDLDSERAKEMKTLISEIQGDRSAARAQLRRESEEMLEGDDPRPVKEQFRDLLRRLAP